MLQSTRELNIHPYYGVDMVEVMKAMVDGLKSNGYEAGLVAIRDAEEVIL